MTTFIIVLLSIAAGLAIIGIIAKIASAKNEADAKEPRGKTTTPTQTLRSRYQNTLAVSLAVLVILLAWLIADRGSFLSAVSNPIFWAGMLLVVVVYGFLLSVPKKFEERWDRKLLMAASLLGGIALIIWAVMPAEVTTALTKPPVGSRPTRPQRVVIAIRPDVWTECKLPFQSGSNLDWEAPGDVEFAFTTPHPDTVRVKNRERKHVNFQKRFWARGTGGNLELTSTN